MTDLDRRVAEWRGWTWDEALSCWVDTDGVLLAGSATYSPETNLLQAFALWNEARPEGWVLKVTQMMGDDGFWMVQRYNMEKDARCINTVQLTDLPRAITTAWIEAKGGT